MVITMPQATASAKASVYLQKDAVWAYRMGRKLEPGRKPEGAKAKGLYDVYERVAHEKSVELRRLMQRNGITPDKVESIIEEITKGGKEPDMELIPDGKKRSLFRSILDMQAKIGLLCEFIDIARFFKEEKFLALGPFIDSFLSKENISQAELASAILKIRMDTGKEHLLD